MYLYYDVPIHLNWGEKVHEQKKTLLIDEDMEQEKRNFFII